MKTKILWNNRHATLYNYAENTLDCQSGSSKWHGKASKQRQPIRNIRKRQSTFLVACWEEKNYSRLQQVEHLWEKKQWKTPREDPWQPSNMAWQDVNTRIDAFCWRPLGVEDSDRKRKSARNVMIKCLSILISYLHLSFHCCVIFLTISCWILDESRSSQSSLFLNRNKKKNKKSRVRPMRRIWYLLLASYI